MKKILKILIGLVATFLFIVFLDIGCIFRWLFGFPCPGCGSTRAMIQFLQGHIVDAFYWHPLFWLTPVLLLLVLFKGEKIFKNNTANRVFWIVIGVIYLAVYFSRMLLLFPDTPPMDYNTDCIFYRLYEWVHNKILL